MSHPFTDIQAWFKLEIFPTLRIDPKQHKRWLESFLESLEQAQTSQNA